MLLRYIFLFVIGYFVWRMLNNVFSKKDGNGSENRGGKAQYKQKPEDKSHIPDDEGDYIDFEEMK